MLSSRTFMKETGLLDIQNNLIGRVGKPFQIKTGYYLHLIRIKPIQNLMSQGIGSRPFGQDDMSTA